MSKQTDAPEAMASIIPRDLRRRLTGWIVGHLPLRWQDALSGFMVQTRLIFSRTILLMLAALIVWFSYLAIGKESHREQEVFWFLVVQGIALAILTGMNLWEAEREGKTFELLIMRIPSVHKLIWFKLRVSLFWMVVLSLPLLAAFNWFAELGWQKALYYELFTLKAALPALLLTCVVSSFVRQSLTTGIITIVIFWMTAGFTENANIPGLNYFRLFMAPWAMEEWIKNDIWWRVTLKIGGNLAIYFATLIGLYRWLRNRLAKTEIWIG